MSWLEDREVERALVITAHPDDADFGAGGTIAGWADLGIDVSYCIVTDGEAGGFDASIPRSQVSGIRRAEQEVAAEVVGVRDVCFLGYPDGRVTVSLELRRDLARVIRRIRPQRLLCSSPQRNWDSMYVDTTDNLHRKVKALLSHTSQLPHPRSLEGRMRGWGRVLAGAGGLPEGRTAEAFRRVNRA